MTHEESESLHRDLHRYLDLSIDAALDMAITRMLVKRMEQSVAEITAPRSPYSSLSLSKRLLRTL